MKRITERILSILTVMALCHTLTSCTAIMDDEPEPCPVGLNIRFVYDYNLERANAFPSSVHCLTVYFYDADGKYVTTRTEIGTVLGDENYRMAIDLPTGDYRIVAYGGEACEDASFSHVTLPGAGDKDSDLQVRLNKECLEPGNPKGHLHDHFYGSVKVNVRMAPERPEVTVKMMKNTNHFRLLLQHMTGEPLDGNDYDFKIVDDNTLFDHTNLLMENGEVTYTPWSRGAVKVGLMDDGYADTEEHRTVSATRAQKEVQIAYADLSTSRLMTIRSPRLSVTHKESGTELISIPLNNYLLALQSEHFDWCGRQEFLDRKSDWQLFFFLDDPQHWNKAFIRIEDWIVRINEIDAN